MIALGYLLVHPVDDLFQAFAFGDPLAIDFFFTASRHPQLTLRNGITGCVGRWQKLMDSSYFGHEQLPFFNYPGWLWVCW